LQFRRNAAISRLVSIGDGIIGASHANGKYAGHIFPDSHDKIILKTSMPDLPSMDPYARHVLLCTGAYCSPDRRGRELYAQLPALLEREGLLFGPRRVKRGETSCLGVCTAGPIVVVYPEGVWYANVDLPLLERIVREHLKEGRVVEEAVFHRL